MGDAVSARKRELRRWVREVSAAAPGSVRRPGAAQGAEWLERRLWPLLEQVGTRRVALYSALPGEIELGPLLEALWRRSVCTALPRVEGEQLVLRQLDRDQPLCRGPLGIREPRAAAPALEVGSVDAFLIPGLCFDRAGRRLGRGRGYYDRLLERARPAALRVGVCFSERLIDEVPAAPWDQSVDYVMTESELLRAEARRPGAAP